MSNRWEEQKEQLQSLRVEYIALFTHLHFVQGLRFAVLGATLPIMAGLFNYYHLVLPARIGRRALASASDPAIALLVASTALGLMVAAYSVEAGIRLQNRVIIFRGAEIESALGNPNGAFRALQRRIASSTATRLPGMIVIGYVFGGSASLVLIGKALLAWWTSL